MAIIKNPIALVGGKPKLQEKLIEIDENGNYIIEPDPEFDGLSRVEIDVDAAGETDAYAGLIDRKVVDFVMPPDKSGIASYLFYSSPNLKTVDLSRGASVGEYAFYNCYYITDLKLFATSGIGQYAFHQTRAVANFDFDPGSTISSINAYAFHGFGATRSGTDVFEFDMRKSTFTGLPGYSFGGNSTYKNKYMRLIFPPTLATLEAFAFAYTTFNDFYFTSATPPTLSASTVWNQSTDYRIFVPFYAINAYRTKTNWLAQTNYIKGYSAENAFEDGRTLPRYNAEGYELTWYIDPDCTIPAETVEDSSAMYYCTAGTTKIDVYAIEVYELTECAVHITDGSSTYSHGEGVLPETVDLTVTLTPNEGYEFYALSINDIAIDNGGTFTMDGNIKIKAVCYNGTDLPIRRDFGDNDWSVIKSVFEKGLGGRYWAVGDIKAVTLTNGINMNVRIVDINIGSGRYYYTGSTAKSKGVFEFVETWSTAAPMNTSGENNGGWNNATLRTKTMGDYLKLLPGELQTVIATVDVVASRGQGPGTLTYASSCKLFVPCEWELFGVAKYGIGSTEGTPQFGYYALNNTNVARQKVRAGTTTAAQYWTRSAITASSYNFAVVGGGQAYAVGANAAATYAAPCFAI